MKPATLQASKPASGTHLVLYDGVCGLCNRLNRFVLPRDTRAIFDFASLQSAAGRTVLNRFGRSPDDLNTFYVVAEYRSESPTLLCKAGASLFILKALGVPWSWGRALGVLPLAFLDRGYDLIAKYRYRLFGRYESCLTPSAEFRNRFIDL